MTTGVSTFMDAASMQNTSIQELYLSYSWVQIPVEEEASGRCMCDALMA